MDIEVTYLRNLLENMGFHQAPDTPVYEDNTACIEWGNHVIGGREGAKHIDLHKHFAHETIQNRMIRLIKIDTSKQPADIFIKSLASAQFIGCVRYRRNATYHSAHSAGEPAHIAFADSMIESRRAFGGVFAHKSMEGPSRKHRVHPSQWHCRPAESAGTRKSWCHVTVFCAIESM